tara:strand:- start:2222 stop:2800 length:579 start_codon:yes stop_codon:yes gene_type:complete
MRLRKIKVYGKLRKFLGQDCFEAAVNSPQQAFNFLRANFEGVEKHMNDQFYKVQMGNRVVEQEFLSMKGEGDIKIIPVAVGSGFFDFLGDVFDFIVDNAIPIVTTIVTGGLSDLITFVALNVVSDLLAPSPPSQPSMVSNNDPAIRGSYNFSGIQNVSGAGTPVPIIYGLVFSGSIIISSGTDSAQIVKSVT